MCTDQISFVCNPKGKYVNLKAINVDEHTHYIRNQSALSDHTVFCNVILNFFPFSFSEMAFSIVPCMAKALQQNKLLYVSCVSEESVRLVIRGCACFALEVRSETVFQIS